MASPIVKFFFQSIPLVEGQFVAEPHKEVEDASQQQQRQPLYIRAEEDQTLTLKFYQILLKVKL